MKRIVLIALPLFGLLLLGIWFWSRPAWSDAEIAALRGLSLSSLPALPPDPSNRVADDPDAVRFGQQLFFEKSLSANGQVACATCHIPERDFQDGVALAVGVGTNTRRTMPLAGAAYSPWLFWDGRKDSLWSQALGPLENSVEHGLTRLEVVRVVAERYRNEYEALFGPLADLSDPRRFPPKASPLGDLEAQAAWFAMQEADRETINQIYANLGKAIAAYERRLQPRETRFDRFVAALLRNDSAAMSAELNPIEQRGLHLFVGKAGCINCHNGPLLTNNAFHNTGVPQAAGLADDLGRAQAIEQVLQDEFNCLGPYSDAEPQACGEIRFLKRGDHRFERQFKPPSLRNVAERAPYMHAGQFASLGEVLQHYNSAPAAPFGHSELEPLNLSAQELEALEAFLGSLSAPLNVPEELLSCDLCHNEAAQSPN